MKYFVYTVVEGFTFIICHDGKGGFEVKNSPPDDHVAQFPQNVAENIAKRNSKETVVYKVMPVPANVKLQGWIP